MQFSKLIFIGTIISFSAWAESSSDEILRLKVAEVVSSGIAFSSADKDLLKSLLPIRRNKIAQAYAEKFFKTKDKLTPLPYEDFFNVTSVYKAEGRIILNHVIFSRNGGRPYYEYEFYTDAWLRERCNALMEKDSCDEDIRSSASLNPYNNFLRITTVIDSEGRLTVYTFDNNAGRLIENCKILQDLLKSKAEIDEEKKCAAEAILEERTAKTTLALLGAMVTKSTGK